MNSLDEGKITPEKALKYMVVWTKSPINESFKDLYKNQICSDLIIVLRNEEFQCHQIVFASNADYFRKVLKRNEEYNKKQLGIDAPFKQTLVAPDWMDSTALQLLIKFMYLGKIADNNHKPTYNDLLNLLKIANYFHLDFLQE